MLLSPTIPSLAYSIHTSQALVPPVEMEPISEANHGSTELHLPLLKPIEDTDPRQSLSHVLQGSEGLEAVESNGRQAREAGPSRKSSTSRSRAREREAKEQEAEEKSFQSDSYTRSAADVNPSYTMTVVHSRRNANGTIGSVYSGNKIRHLKKEDGVPLWRKDIQYAFLQAVFLDASPVFTGMDGTGGHNFADIYIQAMAKSSKTSKILMQKLLTDRESAVNMAMVCLLVNVGRMNTTLNCESLLCSCHANPSSLSRDESSTSNLSFHPLLASPSRSQCLQATPGCASTQVHPQGRMRGLGSTEFDRKNHGRLDSSNQSRQPHLRSLSVRAQNLRDSLPSATRLFRPCDTQHAQQQESSQCLSLAGLVVP